MQPGARLGRYEIRSATGAFVMTRPAAEVTNQPVNISVILNWFEELRERIPLQ
jgi:hypothetical protein